MKPHDKRSIELELARLRLTHKDHLQAAKAKGAHIYAYFCPDCAAPQLSTQKPDAENTSMCSCCGAVIGVRVGPQQTELKLFDSGIKPIVRPARH